MSGTRALLPPLLLAAATLTIAGVLWVGLSGRMAETGLSIDALVTRREELLRRRAAARMRHAAVTDPRALSERAEALGFAPAEPVGRLGVAVPLPTEGERRVAPSPLSLAARRRLRAASPPPSSPWPRLSLPARLVEGAP